MKSTQLWFFSLLFPLIFSSCASPNKDQTRRDPSLAKPASIVVGAVNFKVKADQSFDQHFARIEKLLQKAQGKSVDYLLLPELMSLDFFPANPKDEEINVHLQKLAELAPKYEQALKDLAQKYQVNIIGASTVLKSGSQFINRAFFIKKDGSVEYQDKIYPTPWEGRYNFVGGKDVKLMESDGLKFAVLICHDAEFPNLSSELMEEKPEVIFVPSQTDDRSGQNRVKFTSSARAIEHMAYVVMTGTSGEANAPWHSYVGENFLFRPQNKFFQEGYDQGNPQEEMSVYTLDLAQLRKARLEARQIYPARDAMKPEAKRD